MTKLERKIIANEEILYWLKKFNSYGTMPVVLGGSLTGINQKEEIDEKCLP